MGANLEQVAFERVRDGTLPALSGCRTFGGCGSGGDCAMCGHAIPRSRMEIELEYGPAAGLASLFLHVECYYAWIGALGAVEVAA